MKKIPLTQGKFALVDDEDYEAISKYKWRLLSQPGKNTCYAVRTKWRPETKDCRDQRMHRQLLGITDSKTFVDHKDGNGLNNQKNNLRICTASQNLANARVSKSNSSGLKGVSWHKAAKKWQAYISFDKKRIHIGLFENINDAGAAYDKKAVQIYGAFAKTNF